MVENLFSYLYAIAIHLVILFVIWLILNNIHDRNTEIVLASIGILYSFLANMSIANRGIMSAITMNLAELSAKIDQKEYDENNASLAVKYIMRTQLIEKIYLIAVELLCFFRLYASITGHAWEAVFSG